MVPFLHRFEALALAGVVLSTALWACGDDAGPSAGTPPDAGGDTGPADTGLPDTDAGTGDTGPPPDTASDADGSSDVPAEPQPPAFVVVQVAPARSTFPTGLLITPTLEGWDADGVELGPVAGEFTVEPPTAGTVEADGRIRLLTEGTLVLQGCATDERLTDALCGRRTLTVDDAGPTLELTRPLPGEEFVTAEVRDGIPVEGRAVDTNGEVRVFVNGAPIEVGPDGSFATVVDAEFGINHIAVVATDVLRADETRTAVDVMVAEDYLRYVPEGAEPAPIAIDFPNALTLQLNQRFLDANLTALPDPDVVSYATEDLAGVLELLFRELDLTSQLPNPLVDTPQLFLRATEVEPGTPQIDIVVTTRGVEVFARIPQLFLATQGTARIGDSVLDLTGGVSVSLAGYVRMRLRQRIDEDIDVAVELVDLAVEDITGLFASAQANAIVALAETSLYSAIENVALDLVQDAFLDELPTVLSDAVASIDDLLANQSFPLDLGFGTPLTLTVGADLETLTPNRRNDLTAVLGASVGVDAVPSHPESRGIAMNDRYDVAPSLLQSSRVQIAVRLALLNGLLHSLWNAGLLSIDASSLLPDGFAAIVDRVIVDGRMAPVVRAARPGESDYAILITVGQLELTLGRGDSEDVYGAYITVGANVRVEDSQLVIDLQPEPSLTFWQIELGPSPLFESPEDLAALILTVVWPELAGGLAENLAIDLPRLGTDALGELAPSLSTFALQVVLDRPLLLRDGYLIVDGGLDGNIAP